MKMMKKLSALTLAIVMMLAMTVTAFAAQQEVTPLEPDEDNATITIMDAFKGVEYKVYKLFDAAVADKEGTQNGSGSIAYTGTIPESLDSYFEYIDSADGTQVNIRVKKDVSLDDTMQEALKNWTTESGVAPIVSAVSDGTTLKFKGLPYGYYVVVTSDKTPAITVNSTNPNATIYDKNDRKPTVPTDGKTVTDEEGNKVSEVYIGQTLTYTLKFATTNYDGEDKILKYIVIDNKPEFLDEFTDIKVYVSEDDILETTDTEISGSWRFVKHSHTDGNCVKKDGNCVIKDTDQIIAIPWDTDAYKNGSTIFVTYKATVTEKVDIGSTEDNTNTFEMTYVTDKGNGPDPSESTSSATVHTHALAIQKVDEKGNALAGAKFKVEGWTTKKEAEGSWIVTGKTASGGADTEMTTDENGVLIVKGLPKGNYSIVETAAPNGYNKLEDPESVEAELFESTTTETTIYKDADGKVTSTQTTTTTTVQHNNNNLNAVLKTVVNAKGSILPSTGGIGTTIFYVVGGVLVVAAVVLLVTKKRMGNRA